MLGVRELLAVALGVLFGIGLLVAPRTAVKLSVLGGQGQRRRRGEYGNDEPVADWWVWIARAVGVACLASAVYIAL